MPENRYDFNKITSNPDFQGLPSGEKVKVLDRLFPDFAGLAGEEKQKVLTALPGGVPQQAIPGAPAVSQEPSFLQKINRSIQGAIPDIGLPVGGALAGAAVGAPLGPPGMIAGGILGGMAGRGGGRLYQTYIEGEPVPPPQEQVNEMLREGMWVAAGEGAGQLGGKLLEKTVAPMAGRMTEQGRRILQTSQEYGIPLRPSAIVPSRRAEALETTVEKFGPSRIVTKWQQRKTAKRVNEALQDIVRATGPEREAGIVGRDVKEFLEEAQENFWAESTELYDDFFKKAEGTAAPEIVPKAFRRKMHEILSAEQQLPEGLQDDAVVKFIEDVLGSKKYERFTPRQLHEVQKRLFKLKGVQGKGKLRALKEAIDQDWAAYGEEIGQDVLPALKKAVKHFKKGHDTLIDHALVKKLLRDESISTAVKPQAVITEIFRPHNAEAVGHLMKILPDDLKAAVKTRYLANFFDRANPIGRLVVQEAGPGQTYINGPELYRRFVEHRPVLEQVFDDKTVKALFNLAELARFTMADIAEAYSKMGNLGASMNIAAMGLTGWQSPGLVIGGSASAPFIAKSLWNPKGYLKRLLTEGVKEGTKQTLTLGGRTLTLGGAAAKAQQQSAGGQR